MVGLLSPVGVRGFREMFTSRMVVLPRLSVAETVTGEFGVLKVTLFHVALPDSAGLVPG